MKNNYRTNGLVDPETSEIIKESFFSQATNLKDTNQNRMLL